MKGIYYLLLIGFTLLSCSAKEHEKEDQNRIEIITSQEDTLMYDVGTEVKLIINDTFPYDRLEYKFSGGSLYGSKPENMKVVVAKDSVAILEAYLGDSLIVQKRFQVVKLPYPTLKLIQDGAKINDFTISKNAKSFEVDLVQPEERLVNFYPKDTRYRFKRIKIFSADSALIYEGQESLIDSTDLGEIFRKADKNLIVSIDSIQRGTFRNWIVPLSPKSQTFNLIIK